MAVLTLLDEARTQLRELADMQPHLARMGVTYEQWPLENLDPALMAKQVWDDADKQSLLATYQPMRDRLKEEGYIESDVIALHPAIPGLDGLLARFDKEHFHTDDEVRFIAAGEGIFGFTNEEGTEKFEVLVQAGDFLIVPKNAWHWFTLTEEKRIVAIRFFQDEAGWVANYRS